MLFQTQTNTCTFEQAPVSRIKISAQARRGRPPRPNGARALEAAAGVARAGEDPHLVEDVGLLSTKEDRSRGERPLAAERSC